MTTQIMLMRPTDHPKYTTHSVTSYSNANIGPAYSYIGYNVDGSLHVYVEQNATVQSEFVSNQWWSNWPIANIGQQYQLRAQLWSGVSPTGDALNTWHGMTQNRRWWFYEATAPTYRFCSFSITIRSAQTLQEYGTVLVNLTAETY